MIEKNFLELQHKVTPEQLKIALESTPAKAKIPKDLMDSIAKGCIKLHVTKTASLSFLEGLPGGWFMIATIPTDLAQFFYNALQLAQKLCYLFGWPDFYEKDQIDDETLLELTLFIGAMFGVILPPKSTHKVKQHYELKLVYFSFQTQPEINIPKTNEVFFCCN